MPQTILLIEDDPLSARLADLVLGSEGYQVVVAQNGIQGLKAARETPPDLILLDLMLPGLDGFEVLNRMRADPKTANVRVVIVSSKSQPADKETAAKIGADAYLTKPYRKADLLGMVRSLLSTAPAKEEVTHGVGVLFVGARGDEATRVALQVGLALAGGGEKTTVVDLHPFSVEHAMLLDIPPRPAPASLSDPGTVAQLGGLAVQHPSGLDLINNLEGGGGAGQLTAQDAKAAIDALSSEEGFVLVDVPLYPADIVQHVAGLSSQVVLATRGDAASLAAARSALTLMERASVEADRIGVVFVGPPDEGAGDLEYPILATLPAELDPDAAEFQALAGHLRDLKPSADRGG
jgi:two-component system cell cycle response regulator DivK